MSEAAAGDVLEGVLEITSRVLQAPCVGTDDFFEVGGSSLAAIQIVGLVADRFGVKVTLTDFFDAPDLASFASAVAERR